MWQGRFSYSSGTVIMLQLWPSIRFGTGFGVNGIPEKGISLLATEVGAFIGIFFYSAGS